jgi:hypothetical protein
MLSIFCAVAFYFFAQQEVVPDWSKSIVEQFVIYDLMSINSGPAVSQLCDEHFVFRAWYMEQLCLRAAHLLGS